MSSYVSSRNVAIFWHRENRDVDSGQFSSAVWTNRKFSASTTHGESFSSSDGSETITLKPGVYRVRAYGMGWWNALCASRIVDKDTGTVLIDGMSVYSLYYSGSPNLYFPCIGIVRCAKTRNIALQEYVETAVTTTRGKGLNTSQSGTTYAFSQNPPDEYYAWMEIIKINTTPLSSRPLYGPGNEVVPYAWLSNSLNGDGGTSASALQSFNLTINRIESYGPSFAALTSDDASNTTFTLRKGTYRCWILNSNFKTNRCRIRLYDLTALAVVEHSFNGYGSTSVPGFNCFLSTIFTITELSTFAIEQSGQSAVATNGLGLSAGQGTDVYISAEFWKLD